MYYTKNYIFRSIYKQKTLKPRSGDILLFNTHCLNSFNFTSIGDLVLWEGLYFAPALITSRHVGIIIDDEYYVDSRHPSIQSYDYWENKYSTGPGLRKIKDMNENWSHKKGEVIVLRTNINITHEQYLYIKHMYAGKEYWSSGGCVQIISNIVNYLTNENKLHIWPSDFFKHAVDIGYLKY